MRVTSVRSGWEGGAHDSPTRDSLTPMTRVAPSAIVDFLRSAAGRPLKAKELARGLGVATKDYATFKAQLEQLERHTRARDTSAQ